MCGLELFPVREVDDEGGAGNLFVDDWRAGNGKMCRGAGIGDGHVDCNFYLRSVHEGIGAKVHLLGHFLPCFRSGWERCIVLVAAENGTVSFAVACYDSFIVVVYGLVCILCGGRNSIHIKTNFVVIIIISTRPYLSHVFSLPTLILLPLLPLLVSPVLLISPVLRWVSCLLALALSVLFHVSLGVLCLIHGLCNVPP